MKLVGGLVLVAVLASCGADGPPIRPTMNTSVSVGSNGVSTSTGVTVQSGPISVGASF